MKTKIIKKFDKAPPKAFNNEYPTSHYQFKNPMLMMVCGVRNSGKGYLTSKIVRDANAENLYDVIYMRVMPTSAAGGAAPVAGYRAGSHRRAPPLAVSVVRWQASTRA